MSAQHEGPAQPLGDWLDVAPWKSAIVLVSATLGGETVWAGTVGGKRSVLSGDADARHVVWAGRWAATVRTITPAEAAAILTRHLA